MDSLANKQFPLLTIAVPTYNRADLLDICLSRIYEQVGEENALIEVVVSNNASTDHTKQVIDKFQRRYKYLRYSENEKNGGPDFNIARCFELATAKYVWVFSDDDLLLPNAISNILKLLNGSDLGVVFLKPSFYKDFIGEYIPTNKPFDYEIYDNPMILLEKAHYWITYITGTIINKNLVQDCNSLYRYQNSFLIQLGWVLPALFRAERNIYVTSDLILGRGLEVLDFKLFHVFGASYPRVLSSMVKHGELPVRAKEMLLDLILTIYFPYYLQPGVVFHHGEKPLLILSKAYWKQKEFWNTALPLIMRKIYKDAVSTVKRPFKYTLKNIAIKVHRKGAHLLSESKKEAVIKSLKKFGARSILPNDCVLSNPQFIEIGSRFESQSPLIIKARTEVAGNYYNPSIIIGNGVKIGSGCQIDCCDNILIGDLVLIEHQVVITDNEIDDSAFNVINSAPNYRKRVVKGAVIIGDNVLIEHGAFILSGVTIGHNAIVKAGAIVRESVPAYAVVAGNPAEIIRYSNMGAFADNSVVLG